MKTIYLLLLLLLSALTSFAQNEKVIKQTTLKEVKIYLNGAIVTRTAQVNLESGRTILTIENLSPYMNPQSINVSGKGNVVLISVQHQLNYLGSNQLTPEARLLQDSLDVLKDKMQLLQNSKYVLEQEEQLLLTNKQAGGKDGTTAVAVNSLADFFVQRLTKVKAEQTTLNKKIKNLQDEINKVTNQLALLKQQYANGSSSIVITLSTTARTSATLELSYLTGNASWVPAYDLRASDINSPIALTYKANVTQNTGEDWNDVKLKLSTGNPTLNSDKPNLYPWYLNFLQPVNYGYGSGNGLGRQNTIAIQSKRGEEIPAMAQPYSISDSVSNGTYTWQAPESNILQNQLSTDFTIDLPYTIPSNGKQYMVEVKNYTLNASYYYNAVPKLDKDVFLTAYIKDWESLNLVHGDASVYFQNTYVGNTFINTRNTADSLLFSLGRDKRLIITREKLTDFSSKQFMGNSITRTYNFEFTLKNTKSQPAEITFEDQVPVSQNSDIEIKLLEADGGTFNAENGLITWKVNVGPGETQKRKFSFSVKSPKGKLLNGI